MKVKVKETVVAAKAENEKDVCCCKGNALSLTYTIHTDINTGACINMNK